MNDQTRIPVTGCDKRFPMLDRHGRQLHVGDRIRYQHCTGRYGQTKISETVVKDSHYPYGMIEHASFDFDCKAGVLCGYREHVDFEHGHEKWVEIIS